MLTRAHLPWTSMHARPKPEPQSILHATFKHNAARHPACLLCPRSCAEGEVRSPRNGTCVRYGTNGALGCFIDDPAQPVVRQLVGQEASMTPVKCKGMAAQFGAAYYGVGENTKCYVTNSLGDAMRLGQAPATSCGKPGFISLFATGDCEYPCGDWPASALAFECAGSLPLCGMYGYGCCSKTNS